MTPAPVPDDPNVDLVYGAYQRGMYKTAFDLATERVQDTGDPKAMTMLGELYANALGVKRDYAKAADWYKRAADGGDREAMFALAMLRLAGRGGPANHEEAAKMLASSAKLGNPKAAYNLALLYLDGQTLPQDVKRAAELFRVAADAGNPEANTRWRPSTRKAPASRRTSKGPSGCCRRHRWPTMSMPRSNMPSRSTTAPARRRTRPPRWRCCARPPGKTARSRKTASRACW